MSIQSVSTALVAVMNNIPDLNVYEYEPKIMVRPSLTITYLDLAQSLQSFGSVPQTGTHQAEYGFELRLYVNLETDASTSYQNFLAFSDAIISEFRKDLTLSDQVIRAMITTGATEVVMDVERPYFLHRMTVEVIEEG